MDAVKFLKLKNMICKKYNCCDCPLGNDTMGCHISAILNQMCTEEELVDIVEQWAKEHTKTRQEKFLEQYPEAAITPDGLINILPCKINKYYSSREWCKDDCGPIANCYKCSRDYWNEVISDE